MNSSTGSNSNPAEAYMGFWSEMFNKMAGSGLGTAFGQSRDEAQQQMRQAFFDAWARQCDEFLRSPAFLDMMKQSMDNALAFRKQTNEFLSGFLEKGQMPSRQDTDSILLAVRRLEERLLERLGSLTKRVEALEEPVGKPAQSSKSAQSSSAAPKERSKGAPR